MHAVTEPKGDLLPLTLAPWTLVVVESTQRLVLGPSLAGMLLGLAVVAKPTSLMYTAAVCMYLFLLRRFPRRHCMEYWCQRRTVRFLGGSSGWARWPSHRIRAGSVARAALKKVGHGTTRHKRPS